MRIESFTGSKQKTIQGFPAEHSLGSTTLGHIACYNSPYYIAAVISVIGRGPSKISHTFLRGKSVAFYY